MALIGNMLSSSLLPRTSFVLLKGGIILREVVIGSSNDLMLVIPSHSPFCSWDKLPTTSGSVGHDWLVD